MPVAAVPYWVETALIAFAIDPLVTPLFKVVAVLIRTPYIGDVLVDHVAEGVEPLS